MEIVRFIVGVILPYVAVVVFIGGMAYRFYTWKKLASPPMTLFPSPPDETSNTINTIEEVVVFKSLFKGDRVLWAFAWVFHAVLLLIFVGHFRVFTGLIDQMLMALGMSEQGIHTMSATSGGAAGVIILVALALLLIRRLALERVREVTGLADYLALLLLAAIIITGNMMRFGGEHEPVAVAQAEAQVEAHVSQDTDSAALPQTSHAEQFDLLAVTRDYFKALATFSFSDPEPIKKALAQNLFMVHMFLALLLIMVIPFSKILHLGGIFFTHQLIRKQ